MPTKYIFILED